MTFPISLALPPAHRAALPPACDVVVVGGGVIGVMTAWFLALRGQKVVLCEKGRIAGEQSSRNWGWVRQQGRDWAELPIAMESLSIWQGMAQDLGPGLGFRQGGVAYLAESAAEMEGYAAWADPARTFGLDSRVLTKDQTAALVPGHRARWIGALHTPSDARAEPWTAVPLIARAAAEKGVVIREGCAVRALDLAAGRVAGVITEGGRIACARVLVAGGAWSSLFLRAHGVTIPQLAVRATVARTAPMPLIAEVAAADGHFAFRRRADGGYTLAASGAHDFYLGPDAFRHLRPFLPVLRQDFRSTRLRGPAPAGFPDALTTPRRWAADRPSPFEVLRILNPAPNLAFLDAVLRRFARAFPDLPRPEILDRWAGMIDTMPDVVPVLDQAPVPGLFIATGMSGHGFGIGPGIGRVMADVMTGRAPGHDLARFRLSRFTDGSPLVMPPRV